MSSISCLGKSEDVRTVTSGAWKSDMEMFVNKRRPGNESQSYNDEYEDIQLATLVV